MLVSENLRPLVERHLQTSQIPGITVAITYRNEPPTCLCAGTDAAGIAVNEETLFPVASITKLAVALAILRLADAGALHWNDALALHLPDAAAAQPGVDLRSLLTHTSGLPSSYPDEPAIYKLGLSWPAIAAACLRTSLVQPPHTSVLYGGVGYSLLAVVVERITGQSFPAALSDLVFTPLGIEAYLGSEPPRAPAKLDVGDMLFAGTPLEFFNSAFFRSLGEPAGGLLTTAQGVLRLIGAFQPHTSSFLQCDTATAAIRNQTDMLGGGVPGWFSLPICPWGLGPALHPTFPCIPHQASPTSFGHTGASGCMVWSDPDAEVTWAVLGTQAAHSGWIDRAFPEIGTAILAMLK